MLHKLQIPGFPGWAVGKLIIWLALGAFVGLAYKQNLARKLWLILPLLVVVATVLAIVKP
jgi:hypothetical protein